MPSLKSTRDASAPSKDQVDALCQAMESSKTCQDVPVGQVTPAGGPAGSVGAAASAVVEEEIALDTGEPEEMAFVGDEREEMDMDDEVTGFEADMNDGVTGIETTLSVGTVDIADVVGALILIEGEMELSVCTGMTSC
jgi:hypothetical protein